MKKSADIGEKCAESMACNGGEYKERERDCRRRLSCFGALLVCICI